MLRCLDNTIGLSRYAEPGAWNDPDMLEVSQVSLQCCIMHPCSVHAGSRQQPDNKMGQNIVRLRSLSVLTALVSSQ